LRGHGGVPIIHAGGYPAVRWVIASFSLTRLAFCDFLKRWLIGRAGKMLLVLGTIRIAPERRADTQAAMQKVIVASRKEAGCLEYSYAEDILEAGLIHIVERWATQADFDAHFESGHIAEWCGKWKNLGITDRKLAIYAVGEPLAIPLRAEKTLAV
jgi:quinol monooxygenase YgiN